MKRAPLLVVALLLAACGLVGDDLGQEENELTEVGPHATNSSARIVYPDVVTPLGRSYEETAASWSQLVANIEGVPTLVLTPEGEEGPTAVAESPLSGVAIDVIAPRGSITLAQLSVIDGAGDEDDAGNVAAVLAFLEALGLDASAVIDGLGVDLDDLHGDDQDVEKIYQGVNASVFYAANEDTVLVGVFGPWDR